MYTCSLCNKPQPSHTPSQKVILKARKVEYRHQNETITLGFEPVEETVACLQCSPPQIVMVGEKALEVVPKKQKVKKEFETPRQAKVDSQ